MRNNQDTSYNNQTITNNQISIIKPLFGNWLLNIARLAEPLARQGICLYLVSCILVIPSALAAEGIIKIIAKVNDQVITSKDLNDYCEIIAYSFTSPKENISSSDRQFKKEALKHLIDDKLILDEAKKEQIEIPLAAIESKLNQMILTYPSRGEFEESLAEKGLNLTLLREKIKEQYLMRVVIEKYVKFFITVSPQEISHYYQENKSKFHSLPRYVFYLAKSQNRQAINELTDFIDQKGIIEAQKVHQSEIIKIESDKNKLRKEFSEILDRLSEGGRAVGEIDGLFHLIYLEKIIKPHQLSLVEAKDTIHFYLWDAKFRERFGQWVAELRTKATVQNYYE